MHPVIFLVSPGGVRNMSCVPPHSDAVGIDSFQEEILSFLVIILMVIS